MPSFRVTLAIGALAEAADLQVARGGAQIVVRFTADDREFAAQIAQHVATVAAQLASVESWRVTKREGARWVTP